MNENKSVLASNCGSVKLTEIESTGVVNEVEINLERRHVYSRKTASKNIKALALCAKELLLSLTDVFLDCSPETRKHLKVVSIHILIAINILIGLLYLSSNLEQ